MRRNIKLVAIFFLLVGFQACVPTQTIREAKVATPNSFTAGVVTDTLTSATLNYAVFFKDENLKTLINEALENNQELNIMLQKIAIAKNEVQARKGEYLPFVDVYAGAEVEKSSVNTRNGAVEENLNIRENEAFPDPLPNFDLGVSASWELDVWKKLRSAKKAAVMEYLASVEGKNFMVTGIVSEIANSYYELLAMDYQLTIVKQNLEIQNNALDAVRIQKKAARVNELAVKRFEAEVFKNRSELYEIQQEITVTENKINFLLGRQPKPVKRNSETFIEMQLATIASGIPSQLLQNRPDIRQAELELQAAKMNVNVARANFYPSVGLKAGLGLEAFKPQFLTTTPESLVYNIAGDIVGPLVNRNAIKATYNTANNLQLQAVFEYEKTILSGYLEVVNGLSNLENLDQSFVLKTNQVEALNQSIEVSNKLFQSARADYMEVLLTQRDALEAKIELVETKKNQLLATVDIYKSLGGGWN